MNKDLDRNFGQKPMGFHASFCNKYMAVFDYKKKKIYIQAVFENSPKYPKGVAKDRGFHFYVQFFLNKIAQNQIELQCKWLSLWGGTKLFDLCDNFGNIL